MHNDIMPHFIRQETETWQTVFWGELGKEERKTELKARKIFTFFPKFNAQRSVRFVRNSIV